MADMPPLAPAPDGVNADDWNATCAAIRAYCGWHVAPSHTETVLMDGPGGPLLALPTLHLTALELTNDGHLVDDPHWSASGTVWGHWWSIKPRSIEATMTHGYAECPPELVRVVRSLTNRAAANPTGAARIAAGPFNLSYTTGGADTDGEFGKPSEQAVIDRYRLPTLS